jgi:hypothetical protein
MIGNLGVAAIYARQLDCNLMQGLAVMRLQVSCAPYQQGRLYGLRTPGSLTPSAMRLATLVC